MKNMFIVHGYQANTESHWFQWLADQMKPYGYNVEIVYLPDSDCPSFEAWYQAIQNSMQNNLNSETIIVAHSLGVISTLNYLTSMLNVPTIKGLFLVSGFNEKLSNLIELNQYIDCININLNNLHAQHIVTIGAINDPVVNIDATDRLSEQLNVKTTYVNHNGHFLATEGYNSFNFLKDKIIEIL
ncbi:serine hydrolase family protein [Staphylococcus nepalensis]|uniref:Esterase n=1 Tax=Staphylococcus nepalensis TaxID=214473 RepID=A0A2T4SDV2_9STAP|nr:MULTISPECIES: alpha/beta hydrolase [Staphylococcus]VDG67092.1 esterase [Lacrimispora indolis]MBO1213499.1 serine hydrolase family protein [Staphylococcus nepalensis]MBO1215279.1 serine hydrolase family protein [Staphylococcus nepalensis]MBO1220782.1 serine hydrolase family protein [Staphylococcus nepalensis]MBO1225921.1 serine hydrolase family protein [Staphylococcus nepalensis]